MTELVVGVLVGLATLAGIGRSGWRVSGIAAVPGGWSRTSDPAARAAARAGRDARVTRLAAAAEEDAARGDVMDAAAVGRPPGGAAPETVEPVPVPMPGPVRVPGRGGGGHAAAGARRGVGVRGGADGRTARRGTMRRAGRGAADDEAVLAALLVEAAAVIRAGVAPHEAWRLVLGEPVPDRVPTPAQLSAATAVRGGPGPRGGAGAPVEAAVAAARVANELGAPLAGVLEQVAAAIAARAEAVADVAAALAGPRSSARVLAWLPAAGLLLGTALGADPVGVLLGGGLGTASGAAGVALVLVGRRWAASLLRRAERAGVES